MLDELTKRRINNLKDILVGVLPDPKSQVEQITNALIYKFMNDMDDESIELGTMQTFFSGEYEKYSWKYLMHSKTSGVERVKLYREALESFYTNPNLPPLFREIFKDSNIPFNNPNMLNMFLKEINEFHYSNSENLGDAFEHLLSSMGSQGDAGQFRTPRHIIDFIVKIIQPKKNESILDPSCGTAGFLISSYKYIFEKNTKNKVGDLLNATDRKKLTENLFGYDISPDMVKMSLVNMFLHKFKNPKIYEYDTLSSENRWNEYFDVILANPPFFSPKGGITPHNKFSINSTRAEILFVDYISEHLKPQGRAGIIVPEGIIYQSSNAYKELRKKLIESSLISVISLPPGIFQPYAGVKTSILILDKFKSKELDRVYFQKVNNDGYTLSAVRRPIKDNDLPTVLENYKNLSSIKTYIEKEKLLNSSDYSLLYERYFESKKTNSSAKLISIGEYFNVINGSTPSRKEKKYWEGGKIPWFTIEDVRKQGYDIYYTNQNITLDALNKIPSKLVPQFSSLICCTASVGVVAYNQIELTTNQQFNALIIKEEFKDLLNPRYVFWISTSLKKEISRVSGTTSFEYLSVTNLKKIKIPLIDKNLQDKIARELDYYQTIIDGCNKIINNYKPSIDIDENWKIVKLCNIAETEYGTSNKSSTQGDVPVLRMGNLQRGEIDFEDLVYSNNKSDIEKFDLKKGDLLFNRTNSPELVGKTSIFRGYEKPIIFAGYLIRIKTDKTKVLPEYLNAVLNSVLGLELKNKFIKISGNQANISASDLKNYSIPLPEIKVQRKIVEKIDIEIKIIQENKSLKSLYEKKIKDKINSIWAN